MTEFPERKRKLETDGGAAGGQKMAAGGEKSDVNPWTGRPYSKQYFGILEKRHGLPVWEQRDAFLDLVAKHQVHSVMFVVSVVSWCACGCAKTCRLAETCGGFGNAAARGLAIAIDRSSGVAISCCEFYDNVGACMCKRGILAYRAFAPFTLLPFPRTFSVPHALRTATSPPSPIVLSLLLLTFTDAII